MNNKGEIKGKWYKIKGLGHIFKMEDYMLLARDGSIVLEYINLEELLTNLL